VSSPSVVDVAVKAPRGRILVVRGARDNNRRCRFTGEGDAIVWLQWHSCGSRNLLSDSRRWVYSYFKAIADAVTVPVVLIRTRISSGPIFRSQ
jgi:hypothetical protein